jgi:hypothetical protein
MAEAEKMPRRPGKKIRCAIYTRKSTDEGLEQAFNSLDAQREACAAFVLSQKHEGWTVLPALPEPEPSVTSGRPEALRGRRRRGYVEAPKLGLRKDSKQYPSDFS